MPNDDPNPPACLPSGDELSPASHRGENPFIILGLQPGATHAEVKRAYRALSARLHPDARAGRRSLEPESLKNADETAWGFLRVQEAYRALSDRRQRALWESIPHGHGTYSGPKCELRERGLWSAIGRSAGGQNPARDIHVAGRWLAGRFAHRFSPVTCHRSRTDTAAAWVASALLGTIILFAPKPWHGQTTQVLGLSQTPQAVVTRSLEPPSDWKAPKRRLRTFRNSPGPTHPNLAAHAATMHAASDLGTDIPSPAAPDSTMAHSETDSGDSGSMRPHPADLPATPDANPEHVLLRSAPARNKEDRRRSQMGVGTAIGRWAGTWTAVCLAVERGDLFLGELVLESPARFSWRTIQRGSPDRLQRADRAATSVLDLEWDPPSSLEDAIPLRLKGAEPVVIAGRIRRENGEARSLILESSSGEWMPQCDQWQLHPPSREWIAEGTWILPSEQNPKGPAIAPKYLCLRLERRSGHVDGSFDGNYAVPMPSIASFVRFRFRLPSSLSTESIPWQDDAGSAGTITLFPLGPDWLAVQWVRSSSFSGRPQLSRGASILRRLE